MTHPVAALDVPALLRADAAKNTPPDAALFVARVMRRVAAQQTLQAEDRSAVAMRGILRPPDTRQWVARTTPWLVMGGVMAASAWWAGPATAAGTQGLASWAWAGAAALVAWAMLAPWPTRVLPPDRSISTSD
jgi:hypothetical protein